MSYSFENQIRHLIPKYKHYDTVRRDICSLIDQYSDLRPKADFFVFNDGQRRELICLEGTIPVPYKGNIYNIPICVWLLETQPYNPPMAFVKPTSTMQIKPGKHVDSNGRVYLPYLHEWKHPSSDLFGLVQIMIIVFGEECPVFSRAAALPARPPYPGAHTGSHTPYPAPGGGMPMPVPNPPGGYQQSYRPPTSSYPGYPPSSYGSGGGSYPGYPPPPSSSASSTGGYPYPGSAQPPYPGSGAGYRSQAVTQTSTSHGKLQSTPSLSEDQIKASLLSAVEDKMRRRLKDIFSQAKAEIDSLKKTQEDLNKGKAKLESMVQRLENEQLEVEKNVSTLTTKNAEIQEALESMDNQKEFDIDEAVVPTAPLYKQLLNSFAEEQAIEDTIYYLGEALRKEVIDIDVFLKQVRELSRRQFMLRALITKCRQKAGLPEVVSA